jgi:hypothetical protein
VITIAEVIEQCAKVCEVGVNADKYPSLTDCAAAIRALAAQYEGCIVAEGSLAARSMGVPLYCAKEPTK